MKVYGIKSYASVPFAGENSKANKMKTAAGAAALALAAAVPQEADAQAFYPYYVPPVPYTYYVPAPRPTMKVPDCFVYGDMENFDYDKSMSQVFSEIDSQVDENREISVNEVVKAERKNWNMNNIYPFNSAQMQRTARNFKMLSEIYNESGSNPNTISYKEYKAIMKDYMDSKNAADFLMLLQLLTMPNRPCPMPGPHHHPPVPPHHHHHH